MDTVNPSLVDVRGFDSSVVLPPSSARNLWLLKSQDCEDGKAGTAELPTSHKAKGRRVEWYGKVLAGKSQRCLPALGWVEGMPPPWDPE